MRRPGRRRRTSRRPPGSCADSVPNLEATYELGLAILFLDRLGDPKDEPLIRTMALRLMVGQSASGGWTYNCRRLPPQDEETLLTILQATRPRPRRRT